MKRISLISILYLVLSLHMISFSQEILLKPTFQSEKQKLSRNDNKKYLYQFTKKIEEIQEKD